MALTALFAELMKALEANGLLRHTEISAFMDVARLRLLDLPRTRQTTKCYLQRRTMPLPI